MEERLRQVRRPMIVRTEMRIEFKIVLSSGGEVGRDGLPVSEAIPAG
jgi:hypothetical protein